MKTAFLKTPVEPQLLAAFWALSAQSDVSPSVLLRKIVFQVLTHSGYKVDDYDPDAERTNDHGQWLRRRKKNRSDEDGTHPVIKARVTEGMKAAFERFANTHNRSAPAMLKALIEHFIGQAKIDVSAQVPPKAPPLRDARITVRLSTSEMQAAARHAKEYGNVREWIVAVVRAQLYPDRPNFTRDEVIALGASNRELWSIGHNVNQIARAVNLDMKQTGRLEGSAARVQELNYPKAVINEHTTHVMALCNASFARWGED